MQNKPLHDNYGSLAFRFFILGTEPGKALECVNKAMFSKAPAYYFYTKCAVIFMQGKGKEKAFFECGEQLLNTCANNNERNRYACYLADMLLCMGRIEDARNKIEFAEKNVPKSLELYGTKARYFIHTKDFVQAEKNINALLRDAKKTDDRVSALYIFAQLHAARGEYRKAVEKMREAEAHFQYGSVEIQPFFFDYAEYLLKCGNYGEAKQKLELIRQICNDPQRFDRLMQMIPVQRSASL